MNDFKNYAKIVFRFLGIFVLVSVFLQVLERTSNSVNHKHTAEYPR